MSQVLSPSLSRTFLFGLVASTWHTPWNNTELTPKTGSNRPATEPSWKYPVHTDTVHSRGNTLWDSCQREKRDERLPIQFQPPHFRCPVCLGNCQWTKHYQVDILLYIERSPTRRRREIQCYQSFKLNILSLLYWHIFSLFKLYSLPQEVASGAFWPS